MSVHASLPPVLKAFDLTGRRALITGGSRGLGLEMARALGQAGAQLLIAGSQQLSLDEALSTLHAEGIEAEGLQADLSQPAQAEALGAALLAQGRPVDILINNVGGRRINTPTEELSLEQWQAILDLNLTQAFVLTRTLGAAMLARRWGRIINISSIHAQWPGRSMRGRSYETAKAALSMFTKAVAADWAPQGVTVNAIEPGPFLTDANRRWIAQKPGFEEQVAAEIPMGRWGRPQEIGPLALYLASEAGAFMTGSCLRLDGGRLLW